MAAAAAVTAPSAAMVQAVAGLPPPDYTLPAIAAVNNREQYRRRGEAETEEAQWHTSDELKTLAEPQQVRLKSVCSKEATVVVFINNSPYAVRALWLDFDGNEVVYSELEPRTNKRYHTYVTHPWIIREMRSGTRMLLSGRPAVVGLSTEQTVEVQAPPELNWTLDTHCCFPEQFKKEIEALLLTHKKLEHAIVDSPANSSTLTARSCFTSPSKHCALSSIGNIQPVSTCSPSRRLEDSLEQTACPMCPSGSLGGCQQQTSTAVSANPLAHSKRLNIATTPLAGISASYNNHSSNASGGFSPVMPCSIAALGISTNSMGVSSTTMHSTASITLSAPKHMLQGSIVNTEVTSALTSSWKNTVSHIGLDENCAAAAAFSQGACGAAKRSGLFKVFKNMLTHKHNLEVSSNASAPAKLATLKPKVQAQRQQRLATSTHAAADVCCWAPTDTNLGHLPNHLLVYIAELAHPTAWQTLDQPPKGRPDIKPIIMACAPLTPEQEAEQQLQEQEQQAEN